MLNDQKNIDGIHHVDPTACIGRFIRTVWTVWYPITKQGLLYARNTIAAQLLIGGTWACKTKINLYMTYSCIIILVDTNIFKGDLYSFGNF